MNKRPAYLPLPQYDLKEKDFNSKKAWQTARAKKAGYSSYASWLKERRSEGVHKTNEGRASEKYKSKPKEESTYSQRRELRAGRKQVGVQYYFNVKKDGWSGFYRFIDSLDPQTNVIISMKTDKGDVRAYNSREAVGKTIKKIAGYGLGSGLQKDMELVVKEQSPDKKLKPESRKKGKAIQKEPKIVMVYVEVYGEPSKPIRKYK